MQQYCRCARNDAAVRSEDRQERHRNGLGTGSSAIYDERSTVEAIFAIKPVNDLLEEMSWERCLVECPASYPEVRGDVGWVTDSQHRIHVRHEDKTPRRCCHGRDIEQRPRNGWKNLAQPRGWCKRGEMAQCAGIVTELQRSLEQHEPRHSLRMNRSADRGKRTPDRMSDEGDARQIGLAANRVEAIDNQPIA